MRAVALILGVAACYSPAREGVCAVACTTECPAGLTCGGDGLCRAANEADCTNRPEAGVDVPPAERCFGHDSPPYLRVCLPPAFVLPESRTFMSTTPLDTSTDATCTWLVPNAGGQICVIAAEMLTVESGAAVRGVGSRPLMLLGATAITIRGTVNVASRRAGTAGAGANPGPGLCADNIAGTSTNTATGASGGAGGSLYDSGGRGGASTTETLRGEPAGGTANASGFRGGCPGGAGGPAAEPGPKGGAGGGALYVLTGGTFSFGGVLNASGAGGNVAGAQQGGSGGGSGGMIVVEALAHAIDGGAVAFALGGGGSTGGNATTSGVVGNEPTGPTQYAASATAGGDGGMGGSGSAPVMGGNGGDVNTVISVAGGGGGGGSGGFLYFSPRISVSATRFSPPPK